MGCANSNKFTCQLFTHSAPDACASGSTTGLFHPFDLVRGVSSASNPGAACREGRGPLPEGERDSLMRKVWDALHPHQQGALQACDDYIERGAKEGLVEMFCGTGKTMTFLFQVLRFAFTSSSQQSLEQVRAQHNPPQRGGVSVIVSPLLNLQSQIIEGYAT